MSRIHRRFKTGFVVAAVLAQLFGTNPARAYSEAATQQAIQITENKIRTYLENYLTPQEFSLTVQEKPAPVTRNGAEASEDSEELSGLPGVPGFKDDLSDSDLIDAGGVLHYPSSRPPLLAQVVFDSSLDPGRIAVFKKTLPTIAGLNPRTGDSIRYTSGRLSPEPIRPKTETNWVDSVAKHKMSLVAIAFGLAAAASLLLIIDALMKRVSAMRTREPKEHANPHREPEVSIAKNDENTGAATPFGRLKHGKFDRNHAFSTDAILYQTMSEINEEANSHPERLSRLIASWVERGEIELAAQLLNNFDMKTAETITERLVPSEVEMLKAYLSASIDIFSEANIAAVTRARQDLMVIVSKLRREVTANEFAFLSDLDQDLLAELVRGEPLQVLALISTQIPIIRFKSVFSSISDADKKIFFEALYRLRDVSIEYREGLAQRLQEKLEACRRLVITDGTKQTRIVSLLKLIPEPEVRKDILLGLSKVDSELTKTIRVALSFFEDILKLAPDSLRALLLEVDATILTKAVSGLKETETQYIMAHVPPSTLEIMQFEAANRTAKPGKAEIESAQLQVLQLMDHLIKSGRVQAPPAEVESVDFLKLVA